MIKNIFAMYNPLHYAKIVVYMLQSTEYLAAPYLAWYWRTQNFAKVMYRRQLVRTKAARLLTWALLAGMLLQIVGGVVLVITGVVQNIPSNTLFGVAVLVSYPLVWAHLIVVPLLLGRWFIIVPRDAALVRKSERIFREHPGAKIAVAGSYGKTSMKELLLTVLGEGKKVAATPANKNVASSHAMFATKLDGEEDALIIEFGEEYPGDIAKFSKTTHPTVGVITGLAPAHLNHYKTLDRVGKDLFELAAYLNNQQMYVNGDCEPLRPFIEGNTGVISYNSHGLHDWTVSNVVLTPSSTSFTLKHGKKTLKLTSGLLGRHQIGPISVAAVLGMQLGLSNQQIEAGVAKTAPFEHRMQSRQLGGAWIIDDTYNGNIEGIRAGTELLAALDAKRKIYVTPGLVDQGKQTKAVHIQLGELVAKAKPDQVVLMKNSVTKYIQTGLENGDYQGEVKVEADPLEFYTNLEHFVAAGDLVLMQNDWTDNYA